MVPTVFPSPSIRFRISGLAVRSRKEDRYADEEEDIDDELDDDEDGELNPKMEKAITIMGIAAAVIIVIIIAVLLVNLFGGFKGSRNKSTETETQTTETETETEAGEQVKVPDLSGKTYDEAKAELEKYGLTIENKGEVSSDDYDEGEVANQDLVAGTSANRSARPGGRRSITAGLSPRQGE